MDAICRCRRLLASILVVCLLAAIAVALKTASGAAVQQLTGWIAAAALERNDLDLRVLDRESGDGSVTYLIVGSDRRSGLPRTLPALGQLTGHYADSIMLWSVRPNSGIVVLALPRDIRVNIPQHGDRKLGSVLDYGAAELVSAVKSITSLPIHHYIEVNFEGFTGLVDALGGVDLFIDRPIRDAKMALGSSTRPCPSRREYGSAICSRSRRRRNARRPMDYAVPRGLKSHRPSAASLICTRREISCQPRSCHDPSRCEECWARCHRR